jgi:hypothetical protein
MTEHQHKDVPCVTRFGWTYAPGDKVQGLQAARDRGVRPEAAHHLTGHDPSPEREAVHRPMGGERHDPRRLAVGSSTHIRRSGCQDCRARRVWSGPPAPSTRRGPWGRCASTRSACARGRVIPRRTSACTRRQSIVGLCARCWEPIRRRRPRRLAAIAWGLPRPARRGPGSTPPPPAPSPGRRWPSSGRCPGREGVGGGGARRRSRRSGPASWGARRRSSTR